MITRRWVLSGGTAVLATAMWQFARPKPAFAASEAFDITHTEAEWRQRLTSEEFMVLRESGTERPFTSALLEDHRHGIFSCAGCEKEAFSSATKFDSHTGWPSFWAPIEGGVGQVDDLSLGMTRTAVHCRRCGSHLGHVFDDGPKPTGLRYCMNGVALTFKPAEA